MKHIILAIALITILSGCAGQGANFGSGQQAAIAGQGMMSGSETRSLECSEKAQIAVGVQGAGNVEVKVTDGSGAVVYTKSFDGGGQEGETKSLSGVTGTWGLKVIFTGSYGGFSGQYGVYLRC